MPHPSTHQFAGHMVAWAAAPAAQQRFLQSIGMLRGLDIKPQHTPDPFVGSEPQPWLAALHHFLALARPRLHGVTAMNITLLSTLDAKDMCQLLGSAPSLTALSLDCCCIDFSALASLGLASQLRSLTITEAQWPERLYDEGNPDDDGACMRGIAAALRSASVLTSLTRLDLDPGLESWSLRLLLPTLARLVHLQRLSLTYNISPEDGPVVLDLVSFSNLQPLRQLTDLRFCTDHVDEVSVGFVEVLDVSALTQLRHLSLIGLKPNVGALEALLGLPRLRSLHLTFPEDGSDWRNAAAAVPADAEDAGDCAGGSVRELRCCYVPYEWLATGHLLDLTRIEYEDVQVIWHVTVDGSDAIPDFESAARSLAHCMRLSGAAATSLVVNSWAGRVSSAHQANAVAALGALDTLLRSLTLNNFRVDGALTAQLARSVPHLSGLSLSRCIVADAGAMPALLQLQHLTSLSLCSVNSGYLTQGSHVGEPLRQQLLSHVLARCAAAKHPLQLHVHELTTRQLGECRAAAAVIGGNAQHVTFVAQPPAS